MDSENIEPPREVRRGHMTQWRARWTEDDRVRVEIQPRKHTFGEGMSDARRPMPVWEGPVGQAERLREMLDLLLNDEEELNYADEK